MSNISQVFPTSHVAEVDNYPYGRLKCRAFFGTEFKKGKGFRSTFQTINPKTWRLNAVKNSTYYPVMLMYQDVETGYYKHLTLNPDSDKGVQKVVTFVLEHHDKFTEEELKYIAGHLAAVARAGMQALVTYCGADADKVVEVGKPGFLSLLECFKNPTLENWQAVNIDADGLNALKVEGFNPFKITTY